MLVKLIEKLPVQGDPPGLYLSSGSIYVISSTMSTPLCLWGGEGIIAASVAAQQELNTVVTDRPQEMVSAKFFLQALAVASGKIVFPKLELPE